MFPKICSFSAGMSVAIILGVAMVTVVYVAVVMVCVLHIRRLLNTSSEMKHDFRFNLHTRARARAHLLKHADHTRCRSSPICRCRIINDQWLQFVISISLTKVLLTDKFFVTSTVVAPLSTGRQTTWETFSTATSHEITTFQQLDTKSHQTKPAPIIA